MTKSVEATYFSNARAKRSLFFIIVIVDVVLSFGVPDDVVHVVDCPSVASIVNEIRHKISCF